MQTQTIVEILSNLKPRTEFLTSQINANTWRQIT